MPTRCRNATGALIVAVLLALAPAGASAATTQAGPLQYELTTVSAGSWSQGSVAAPCPTGGVTGGGGAIAGTELSPEQQETALASIAPYDGGDLDIAADDGYAAAAYNDSDDTRTVTAIAICLKERAASLRYERNATTTASSEFGQAVSCEGAKLLGGGAYVEGPHSKGSAVLGSKPYDDDGDGSTDDGWSYWAAREPGGAADIAARATCIPPGKRPIRYRSGTAKVGAGEARAARVACPRGFHASGGGIFGGSYAEQRIRASRPFDGKDAGAAPDDGWKASVHNLDDAPRTITVHAICLR
jgi:hypothetical protein